MKEHSIHLSKEIVLPFSHYVTQANAILGIRDSGKSYTAMKIAEELMTGGIPIIAFDPVGIWKGLKMGVGKHPGFPVVVAGGQGSDIIINKDNAVDVVEAAMKENISLVVDFYSTELINKSTWIRIVQETVDHLMYKNKDYGIRHVFLEEAAEFIPQRLQPQQARVYASIERLARMGRNAMLGLTIINQRAEEVNKAILEICACSFLHKQVGKNSLKSIEKWLDLLDVPNQNEIIRSLPKLLQGECWIIGLADGIHKLKVSERKTFHPDPSKGLVDVVSGKKSVVNVSDFVEKMNRILKEKNQVTIQPLQLPPDNPEHVEVDSIYQQRIESLETEVGTLRTENAHLKEVTNEYQKKIDFQKFQFGILGKVKTDIDDILKSVNEANENEAGDQEKNEVRLRQVPVVEYNPNDGYQQMKKITDSKGNMIAQGGGGGKSIYSVSPVTIKATFNGSGDLNATQFKMLAAVAQYSPKSMTKRRMSVLSGFSMNSSAFPANIRKLRDAGYITVMGDDLTLTAAGKKRVGKFEPLPSDPDQLIQYWINRVSASEGRMLAAIAKYKVLTYEQMSKATGLSMGSSGFIAAIRGLKKLEFVTEETTPGEAKVLRLSKIFSK